MFDIIFLTSLDPQPSFGPLNKRDDGTYVFATPVGNGHVPMIALKDLGFWARYTFDNIKATAGKELEVASDMVDWEYLRETFEKFTGNKAIILHQSAEDWMKNLIGTEHPQAASPATARSHGRITSRIGGPR